MPMKIIPFSSRGIDSTIYLVRGKTNTLIDTGTGTNGEDILKRIEEELDGNTLDRIVLTHEHFDHIGGVHDLVARTGAMVFASECTYGVLREGDDRLSGALLFGRRLQATPDCTAIADREYLDIGDDSFRVIYTPGHSPGSISLFSTDTGVLFSGDTVFTNGGVGRWDLPGGDLGKLVSSIHELSLLDTQGLYPGHGEPAPTDGKEHVRMALRYIRLF